MASVFILNWNVPLGNQIPTQQPTWISQPATGFDCYVLSCQIREASRTHWPHEPRLCLCVRVWIQWTGAAASQGWNTEILSARKSQHNMSKTQNLECTGIWSGWGGGGALELCASKNNNNVLLCRSLHVESQAYCDHRTGSGFLSRDAKNS